MKKRAISLLPVVLFTLLAGILAGCSGYAATQTPAALPKSTQTAEHPAQIPVGATSPPAPAMQSPLPEESRTPSISAPYHVIDPSDFSLGFKLSAPTPSGEYIVSVEEAYTTDQETQIYLRTMSGDIVSSLDVELISNDFAFPRILIEPIQTDSKRLLIGIVDNSNVEELYVFDVQTENVWGIALECNILTAGSFALGRNYLAFRCFNTTQRWFFVDTADPTKSYTFKIRIAEDPFEYDPVWMSEDEIYFRGEHKAFCFGSIPDWDPVCGNMRFWPGVLNTDAGLLEVRAGDPENPMAVGVLSLDCFSGNPQACDGLMIENPFNSPQMGAILPISSSWEPGTTDILYLLIIDHDLSTNAADETELWMMTYPEGTITKLDVLKGEFGLNELTEPNAPAIWLDNGKEVVLNKLTDLVIYNIETGEQRSIGDPGDVLGKIEIE